MTQAMNQTTGKQVFLIKIIFFIKWIWGELIIDSLKAYVFFTIKILNHSFSPLGLRPTGIKLGIKHVICQNLAAFFWKNVIYAKRLESFIFSM